MFVKTEGICVANSKHKKSLTLGLDFKFAGFFQDFFKFENGFPIGLCDRRTFESVLSFFEGSDRASRFVVQFIFLDGSLIGKSYNGFGTNHVAVGCNSNGHPTGSVVNGLHRDALVSVHKRPMETQARREFHHAVVSILDTGTGGVEDWKGIIDVDNVFSVRNDTVIVRTGAAGTFFPFGGKIGDSFEIDFDTTPFRVHAQYSRGVSDGPEKGILRLGLNGDVIGFIVQLLFKGQHSRVPSVVVCVLGNLGVACNERLIVMRGDFTLGFDIVFEDLFCRDESNHGVAPHIQGGAGAPGGNSQAQPTRLGLCIHRGVNQTHGDGLSGNHVVPVQRRFLSSKHFQNYHVIKRRFRRLDKLLGRIHHLNTAGMCHMYHPN
mmetsp:Transcript_24302/g.43949  ORF Transcript_24302/g.43949 Transcript_24302/m.43949 type:complete len:377 (-) Transcript_24302:253-1383(-)